MAKKNEKEEKQLNKKNTSTIQLILTVIVVVIAVVVYIFSYKSPIDDPIANIKDSYLNSQFASIGVTFLVMCVIRIFLKDSKKLLLALEITLFATVVAFTLLYYFKVKMNEKYDRNAFAEFYREYEMTENDILKPGEEKTIIDIGMTGMEMMNEEQAYIKTSQKIYKNFTYKVTIYAVLHIIIIVVLIVQVSKLSAIEKYRKKIQNGDILF